MKVKVISKETIKPSHPTPKHLNYLKGSLFDSINSPILVPLIYFYSLPKSPTITTTTNYTFLNTLKTSLADTLSVFYPLAGRINDKNGIHCNDEGVPYVEAEVTDTRFEDIVDNADVFELDPLQPNEGQDGFSSLLLVVQVTTFPCGGVTVGLKMNHLISDGISLVMFVNAWASIAKGQAHPNTLLPRPYFDIWKVFPQHNNNNNNEKLANIVVGSSYKFISKPLSKRFVVSKDKLVVLRTKLYDDINKDKSSSSSKVFPSLFMVLSAFIWSRVSITRVANNDTRPCIAYQSVNLRTKVESPHKNSYYFGNLVAPALVETSISQALINNLDTNNNNNNNNSNNSNNNNTSDTNNGVLLMRHMLSEMNESVSKILSDEFTRDIRQGREKLKYVKEVAKRVNNKEITLLKFSNLRGLPAYDADFGWGRPAWVSSGSWSVRDTIFLTPASPVTARDVIEFYINLRHKEMDLLVCDKEFCSFVSKASGIARNSKL